MEKHKLVHKWMKIGYTKDVAKCDNRPDVQKDEGLY